MNLKNKILISTFLASISIFGNTGETVKYKNVIIPKHSDSSKRELRAAWIASVFNIDWPSKQGLSIQEQKDELIKLLDEIKAMNMNAVIMQIRPTADRLYSSPTAEPWSKYLTGTENKDPGYDPLKFMIEESHKRNLEFHAWFNPYRITATKGATLSENHVANKNSEWVVEYDGKLYYDPGHPQAKKFTQKIILDVVNRYDIDAVHMDDYFYPYPTIVNGNALPFPDDNSYKASKSTYPKDKWRRENVNTFVKETSTLIKKVKPYVKFGISPFGVWRNNSVDRTGSNTSAGHSNYDSLYADTRKWIKMGWIDYITPQIYWEFDLKVAPYGELVNWWSKEVDSKDNVHLYIGQGAYKIGTNSNWGSEEVPNQIKYNRTSTRVNGSMYYGLKSLITNKENIKESLKTDIYSKKSLIPTMPWIDNIAPKAPISINLNNNTLTWKDSPKNDSRYYVIYQNDEIIETIPRLKNNYFKYELKNNIGQIKISAVDRLHNESDIIEVR
ncbi:glycoside hydrolase family 10 protein [Cetobacterium sp.]|uniref:glycoside hydrolase family 10 protein n=1 Tax=Cetobacterium sp. TaxID=2071632 RepID=UPI003F401CB1